MTLDEIGSLVYLLQSDAESFDREPTCDEVLRLCDATDRLLTVARAAKEATRRYTTRWHPTARLPAWHVALLAALDALGSS